jgi:hypothetical protein
MIGEIGWIIISFGVLYLVYQVGRIVKNNADYDETWTYLLISKMPLTPEQYEEWRKRFSTRKRFWWLEFKVKRKIDYSDVKEKYYKKVMEIIDKEIK